nr:hypothetical protein [Raoultella planticola]
MTTDITELTQESARESGSILIIVAARMARREFFTPLHALCESGKRVVSTRALCDAVERAEERMVSQVPKIVDGHDRLTKKLKETESRNAELVEALEKAQAINAAAEKLVRCKGRYHSEQNYRALAALFGVTTPDLPPLDGEPVGEVIEVGDALLVEWHKNLEEGAKLYTAPQAPVMPFGLHPDTQKLVTDFCTALAEKLYKAQLKYGYDTDWKQDGWPSQCQAHFHQHIAKGDPRDVAAYCAFMWWHGWSTKPAEELESRTVTVSKSDIFNVPGGETYAGGEMIPVDTLCLYLAEHGIKWEAE